MDQKFDGIRHLGRRDLLIGTAGAAALGGRRAAAQSADPWAIAPKTKVDKLHFVVWTYGDIYTKISAKFKSDWGPILFEFRRNFCVDVAVGPDDEVQLVRLGLGRDRPGVCAQD